MENIQSRRKKQRNLCFITFLSTFRFQNILEFYCFGVIEVVGVIEVAECTETTTIPR